MSDSESGPGGTGATPKRRTIAERARDRRIARRSERRATHERALAVDTARRLSVSASDDASGEGESDNNVVGAPAHDLLDHAYLALVAGVRALPLAGDANVAAALAGGAAGGGMVLNHEAPDACSQSGPRVARDCKSV